MRRWGSAERMSYAIMSGFSQVTCRCGHTIALLNPVPLFANAQYATCPKCGREHRIRLVVESRSGQ